MACSPPRPNKLAKISVLQRRHAGREGSSTSVGPRRPSDDVAAGGQPYGGCFGLCQLGLSYDDVPAAAALEDEDAARW